MYTTNQPIGSTVDNYDITSPSIKRYNNMKNQTNTRKRVEEIMEEFVEKGANLEHDRWARWQKYMFSKCKKHIILKKEGQFGELKEFETGALIVPKSLVDKWFRQIDTPYSELSKEEKESDRKETRNYLPLLSQALSQQLDELKGKIKNLEKDTGWVTITEKDWEIKQQERFYNESLSDILTLIDSIK